MKVNTKVAADDRIDMGCSTIWKGTTKIFKSISCIYMTLTCGPKAGSILYKAGIGSASFKSGFGLLDINEGIQDIYYGWNGDIDTETINYLKDVLGEKAYNNIEKYATITMNFTMFADFVLAVDSWVNGFGMLSGETEMAGEMAALESLENVELAEIESVELANAETVTIETVEGEVVEIEAAAECGSSIGEAGLVENEIKGGSGAIVNSKGVTYPEVIDIRTGQNMVFPEGVNSRIPKESRVGWYRNQTEANLYRVNDTDILCKKDYIDEWYRRGYQTPEGGWDLYEIHHIKPREFGGSADFDNMVPLLKDVHRKVVTPWWNGFD